jgi:hypothetical protein
MHSITRASAILQSQLSQRTSKNALNQQDAMVETKERELPAELPGPEYKMKLVWRNIVIFTFLHIGAVYGYMTLKNSWSTVIFSKSQHLHQHSSALSHRRVNKAMCLNFLIQSD